jgi:2-octaprenyl-6-methoxyphenol hydroxylase
MRRKALPLKSDVLIVGGGHAGLSLAASLGMEGISVTCLEQGRVVSKLVKTKDARTLALSFRSMNILRKSGVWPLIQNDACPILDIRVADQDSSSYVDFRHREVGHDPFGWIIENHKFNLGLEKRVKQLKHVHIIVPAKVKSMDADDAAACITLDDGRRYEASLVIGADGRQSLCRALAEIPTYGWSYQQTAIICTIHHSLPHNNIAVEHFQAGGPFATLPMTKQRSGVVWTEGTEAAEKLMVMNERDFISLLQEKVRTYLGQIKLAGSRQSYPLTLQHAEYYTAPRLALVGDAAHGIHPIAGQGFNLGMGDIGVLVDEIIRAARFGLDLGSPSLLRRYEKRRKVDNGAMVIATDLLDRLFSNSIPSVQAARRFGLRMVKSTPSLRRFFMRTAMGRVS